LYSFSFINVILQFALSYGRIGGETEVMYVITEYEKAKAIQHTEDLASLLVNNSEGALYYKIFTNFIIKSYPNKKFQIEDTVTSHSAMINNLSEMLKYMINVAAEGASQKLYTTGQLSKFFGVSITSINNWIKENRFIGIQRTARNKQVRIPENAMWRSPNGELIPVKEIIDMWNKEHLKRTTMSKEEEKNAIQNEISFFEKKYGGSYEKTLMQKEPLTESELQDKMEWEYLLKRRTE